MRQVRGRVSEYCNSGMSRQKNYSAEFKSQAVLELLRGDKPLNELAEQYQITPATLSSWHRVFQERARTVFQQGPTEQDKEITRQNAEIEALLRRTATTVSLFGISGRHSVQGLTALESWSSAYRR